MYRGLRKWVSGKSLIRTGYYLIPAFVVLLIWVRVVGYYYVPSVVITEEMLDKSRDLPPESILEELSTLRVVNSQETNEQLINAAEKLLQGRLEIPGYPATEITMPFNARDLDGPLPLQLAVASLKVPEILLNAYRITGRNVFIRAARDVILGFALYERRAWFAKGLLWNDHAISERILVLAEFWRLYRHHPDFDSETAKAVLQLVARTSQLLAKHTLFTVSTNHGVMQNLALWHLCLSFPMLPKVEEYKVLAFERMSEQMAFYVNQEGVVLEHSAGYHRTGLEFVGMAFRYLTLLQMPIPDGWREKYEKAKNFYAHLRRPDGSLPVFGDTSNSEDPLGPLVSRIDTHNRAGALETQKEWIPKQPKSLYPVAGYCIWWDGLEDWPNIQKLAQTVVVWSNFPGHGHKHADEASVLVWAGGQTWWTNVGYWPYGVAERSEAESWDGSNAPHLIDEAHNSERTTRLRYFSLANDITVADIERNGPGEFAVRRQVIRIQPNLWLTVDHTSGSGRVRTIWTTSHDVRLTHGQIAGSYRAQGNTGLTLTGFILASEPADIKLVKGSFAPFAGWSTVNKPAGAIVVEQPAKDSWSVAIWSLDSGLSRLPIADSPRMTQWRNVQDWAIALPFQSGALEISRNGGLVSVRDATGVTRLSKLTEALHPADQLSQVRDSYSVALSRYPQSGSLVLYRSKLTWLLIIIFLIQEGFFSFCRRISRGRYYTILRSSSLVGWAGGGLMLVNFFDSLVPLYIELRHNLRGLFF